ncbi:MAG: type II secretion system protein [Longimicrobiales bacterium]|nr:type II secretion system protein [Longimicrobiales bacterium]
MTTRSPARRGGFTLTEMLIVAVVVGILGSIALPELNRALNRARAAAIMADLHTVRLAAHEAIASNGVFPAQAGWGVVPPAMKPFLPENFSFNRGGKYRYRWRLIAAGASPWGVPTGRLHVQRQAADPRLIQALAAMSNPNSSIVTGTQVQLWVLP